MMKIVLMYLIFAAIIGGVWYGMPELRNAFRLKTRRRLAVVLVVPLLILLIIYQLEFSH